MIILEYPLSRARFSAKEIIEAPMPFPCSLSGDRHHSEIIKHEGVYTFYDVTVSPLTSGVSTARENEKLNPSRVGPLIREQNYARISVAGNTGERKLRIDFINKVGTLIYSWQVTQKELKAAP